MRVYRAAQALTPQADAELRQIVPEPFARRHRVLPLSRQENILTAFCVVRFTAPPRVTMFPAPTVRSPVLSVTVNVPPVPDPVFVAPDTVSVFPPPTSLPV